MRNKGMKLLSKIVAACIALVLTISMGVPVQASIEKNETHTITVNGKETDAGATVDVYKIMDVKFDYDNQQPINPTYVWVDGVASWLTSQKGFESYVENNNEVPKSFEEVTGAELSNLMRKLEDAIISGEIKLNKAASATMGEQEPTLIFDGMKMGQYLILTTPDENGEHSTYEYAPATANIEPVYDETQKEWFAYDVKVTIKGSPAAIEKEVDDHTVEIGQKVNYTVNVPVPYYPEDAVAKFFRIGDQLPIGITFGDVYEDNKLTVTAVYEDGHKIEIGTSMAEKQSCFTYFYQVTDCGNEGIFPQSEGKEGIDATFLLDFEYDVLMEKYGTYMSVSDDLIALKEIEVTYTGTINENAILRPGDPGYPEDADPLENKAYVGQNNDPYDWDSYKPSEDKEKVYTYAINVTKVAEDGNTPLTGAQFQLFTDKEGKNPVKFVELKKTAKDKDGNLVKSGVYRKAKEDETKAVIDLEVANGEENKGKLALEGLATGTYYLKETKAPDGYEVLDEMIKIEIVDEDEDGKIPAPRAGDVEADHVATNVVYKTVVNRKPPIMPITGGMGTVIFSIVGIVLVVGGIMLITGYQRRRRA